MTPLRLLFIQVPGLFEKLWHAVNDRIMSDKAVNQRPLTYDFMMHDYNTYCLPVVIDNPDIWYQLKRGKSCSCACWERLLERIFRLPRCPLGGERRGEFRSASFAGDDSRRRKTSHQL